MKTYKEEYDSYPIPDLMKSSAICAHIYAEFYFKNYNILIDWLFEHNYDVACQWLKYNSKKPDEV